MKKIVLQWRVRGDQIIWQYYEETSALKHIHVRFFLGDDSIFMT